MFLIAKDDPITRFSSCPRHELHRNPNFITLLSDAGGHCEFYHRVPKGEANQNDLLPGGVKRFTPGLIIDYFTLVQ